jgi:acetyltransferase-like isoleucine patch superfamily enzyme
VRRICQQSPGVPRATGRVYDFDVRAHGLVSRLAAEVRARSRGLSPNITIGRGVRFGRRVRVAAPPGSRVDIGDHVEIGEGTSIISTAEGATLTIGEDVFISGGCTIAAAERIEIGRGSMIGEFVSIRDHDHDPAYPPLDGRMLISGVVIGDRVWIGAKATIVRGGQVGSDSVIGANSVVNRAIPPHCLAAGVPAHVKRDLAPPTLD